MASNPSFKVLHFLSHMDLKKEVRKHSFSNPAFSASFLQNKLIDLCKQSPWPQALRNISFLFQKLPHLPSSGSPEKLGQLQPSGNPRKVYWQAKTPALFLFFIFNNLHILNGVRLEWLPPSVQNCFLMHLSYLCLLFLSKEQHWVPCIILLFLVMGKKWKTPKRSS